MDWFLHDKGLRHEGVNDLEHVPKEIKKKKHFYDLLRFK